jgi:glutamine synthetase
MFHSLKEAQEYCKKHDIKMIDFKLVDLDGRWRHLLIPSQRLNEGTMKDGIGFDGSSYGFAPVECSDMVFIPILESAVVDPYMDVPTLTMIADVWVIDPKENYPFGQYPRNVAKAAVEYMKKENIADEMLIGPEYEFHIFDHVAFKADAENSFHRIDTEEAHWNSGRDDDYNNGYHTKFQQGYHACLPQDVTCDLRTKMCLQMEDWGIDIKYQHHEVGGPGQVEIEVELGDMVSMADNTMVAKYIIKNEAVKDGKTATFMPKPLAGQAGSGLHVHMLLNKDGKPLFYDENGYSSLSQTAHYFIGGLLKHARSLCAFTNPSTNSYSRLIPGFEAPVTIGYATANRSSVVRIPSYVKDPSKKRFELRNPDATCNPYYAYAAILMAGLDGIKNKIDPKDHNWGPFDFNLFDLPEEEKAKLGKLPSRLGEALDALEEDHEYLMAGNVFPKRLIDIWIAKKRKEEQEVLSTPSPAEFTHYYDL